MKNLFKYLGISLVFVLLITGIYGLGIQYNWYGQLEEPGIPIDSSLPDDLVQQKEDRQKEISSSPKQILFGDTHVHTTYSTDAFLWSLPIFNGEGPHPISDACDYARFCAALDFWVTTDHAEASTPRKWKSIKDAVRQCNAPSNAEDPDMVTFLGFEWTQVGLEAQTHYGHKNVIFLDTEETKVPLRPIGAGGLATNGMRSTIGDQAADLLKPLAIFDFPNRQRYFDFASFVKELSGVPFCEEGISSSLLPEDCYEFADTPEDLFRKLDELNYPSIVIPHGNTWGFYTPPGSSLDKQLEEGFNNEDVQILFEVMSGHGNSEEYRPWRAGIVNDDGSVTCPKPSKDYLPSCWRAGEIIALRCASEGFDQVECEKRAEEARNNNISLGVPGHLIIPGVQIEDWLDAGQCKDCFIPSFNYRPAGSAQYALALGNFDSKKIKRFRFGFIASSDNHRARPGTGYKEIDRFVTTEANGPPNESLRNSLYPVSEPVAESLKLERENLLAMGFGAFEAERMASFFTTGGLAAVHSLSRTRQDIWSAMKHKETYGTSGDRILLWFDLIDEKRIVVPMGGDVQISSEPNFRVRAVGAFKQKPGCPEYDSSKVSSEDLARICKNECYNPSDERKNITRIEVIRILPQLNKNEDISNLIQDPWKSFTCPVNQDGCEITFGDPEFPLLKRDIAYYVRAIQEPSPTINSESIRCKYDAEGKCEEVNICYGDYRTSKEDDCLSMSEERAWSSPIFVDFEEN